MEVNRKSYVLYQTVTLPIRPHPYYFAPV